MLFVARGMKIALQADDGFSKLLAAGLTFGFALQTFIIVGGVLRLIPLTGITLPFVSYGGSSVVANFALLAGLLARLRPGEHQHVNKQISRVALVALLLLAVADRRDDVLAGVGGAAASRRDRTTRSSASRSSRSSAACIYASDGKTVLAKNRVKKAGGQTLYFRTYPTHGLRLAGRRLLDAGPLACRASSARRTRT